jgi:hypothetical protein
MLQLAYPNQTRQGVFAEGRPDKVLALTPDTLSQGTAGVYWVLSQGVFAEPKPSNVLALTLDTLSLGTAGGYSVLCDFQGVMDFRGPVQVKTNRKQVAVVYAPSTAQLLSTIRDVFALRMSELAQIFGVSRRAAYDWLEGVTPKPDTVSKIYTLSRYAEELRTAGITNIEHYVHRPVVSGRSLLELLKSGENIETAIAIIKRTASEEANNRKQLGKRTSETSTANVDGFDEVSTPILD